MNIPNAITTGRLLLAILFFGLLSLQFGLELRAEDPSDRALWLLDVALVIFIVAGLTDVLDGYLARRMNLVTTFGRVADPVVDKIMVCGSFVYFVSLSARTFVEPWMVVLILGREFLVTAVRSLFESEGRAFGALFWGKAKMFVQCITIAIILVYLGHYEGKGWATIVAQAAVYTTVVVTLASCLPYLKKVMGEATT